MLLTALLIFIILFLKLETSIFINILFSLLFFTDLLFTFKYYVADSTAFEQYSVKFKMVLIIISFLIVDIIGHMYNLKLIHTPLVVSVCLNWESFLMCLLFVLSRQLIKEKHSYLGKIFGFVSVFVLCGGTFTAMYNLYIPFIK